MGGPAAWLGVGDRPTVSLLLVSSGWAC